MCFVRSRLLLELWVSVFFYCYTFFVTQNRSHILSFVVCPVHNRETQWKRTKSRAMHCVCHYSSFLPFCGLRLKLITNIERNEYHHIFAFRAPNISELLVTSRNYSHSGSICLICVHFNLNDFNLQILLLRISSVFSKFLQILCFNFICFLKV